MPALTQLTELHEALAASARRKGREDEDAENAAVFAGQQLRALFTDPVDQDAVAAFWKARPPGLSLHELLKQIYAALPPRPELKQVYRGIAATLPAQPKLVPLHNLAWTLDSRCDDPEAALPLFERAHKMAPKDLDVLLCLAVVKRKLGDVEGALKTYDRMIKLDDQQLAPWLNAGQLLKGLGRWRESASYMARAVAIDDCAEHLHIYGHVLQECGEAELGEQQLRAAVDSYGQRLRQNGTDPEARYWRAAALARLDEVDEALGELAIAVALDGDLRAAAREEEDFVELREDARFQEITWDATL